MRADDRARGRGRARGRQRPVRRAAAGAARPGARGARRRCEIGLDAGAVPPTSSSATTSPRPRADRAAPGRRVPDSSRSPRRARRFACSSTAPRSTRRAAVRSATRALIRTHTGIVRVHRHRSRRAIARSCTRASSSPGEIRPGQDAHAEVDAGSPRGDRARAHLDPRRPLRRFAAAARRARPAGRFAGRRPAGCGSTSPIPAACRSRSSRRRSSRRTGAWRRTMPCGSSRPRWTRRRRSAPSRCSGRSTATIVRVVEIGDYSRELCGGTHVERTGNVAVIRLLHEGSIGAGMRRVEALVGPDALREINAERALLRDLVERAGSQRPARRDRARPQGHRGEQAPARASSASCGRATATRSSPRSSRLPSEVDGVALVVSEVPGEDPGGLRELAQKSATGSRTVRPRSSSATASGGKAMLVAAATPEAVARGVTAPGLLGDAATVIGGGAGGKDILANAGGPARRQGPASALGGIAARRARGRSWSARERRTAARPGRSGSISATRGSASAISDPDRRLAVPDRHDPCRAAARRAVRGRRPRREHDVDAHRARRIHCPCQAARARSASHAEPRSPTRSGAIVDGAGAAAGRASLDRRGRAASRPARSRRAAAKRRRRSIDAAAARSSCRPGSTVERGSTKAEARAPVSCSRRWIGAPSYLSETDRRPIAAGVASSAIALLRPSAWSRWWSPSRRAPTGAAEAPRGRRPHRRRRDRRAPPAKTWSSSSRTRVRSAAAGSSATCCCGAPGRRRHPGRLLRPARRRVPRRHPRPDHDAAPRRPDGPRDDPRGAADPLDVPGERSVSSVIEEQTGVKASVFATLAESGRYSLPPYLPKGRDRGGLPLPGHYEFVQKGLDAKAIIKRMFVAVRHARRGPRSVRPMRRPWASPRTRW